MTREGAALWIGALACVAVSLGLAARDLDAPGLYYDEVIQAEPALWFLRAEPAPPEMAGTVSVRVSGRPFPWMTQPYMGAFKSQVLLPLFALAPPDPRLLRLFTLAIALAGLACAMAFTRRACDLPTALLCGALLALDPSLLFIGRHDWGSFSLGFLLRSAAALALLSGWRARHAGRLFVGAVCAGLAFYNKIDAAVPLAAAAAALALSAPSLARELCGRAGLAACALAGLLLGAAPMLWHVRLALAMTDVAARTGAVSSGEWVRKWNALGAALDGSYFERLILAGGSFERMAEVQGAAATPFRLLFLLSTLGLALWLAREHRRGRRLPAQTFALTAALFTLAGVLLTPHAVRIHHFLNAWPLPHLVVAIAVREAWRRWQGRLARAALALALALGATGLAALRADLATLGTARATGGKGLRSDAVVRFAPELSGTRVVCLDWGFAAPLRFTDPALHVEEPIWRVRGGGARALEGDAQRLYLLHERAYAVFPFGPALLDAVAALPPGAVSLRRHPDRTGDTAFLSLRFAGPHRLVYHGGRFEVQLR